MTVPAKYLSGIFDPRANAPNAVRLGLATGVIIWHSFPLTGRDISWSPLRQLLGEVWVDGFFAISGFLIVSSWIRDPSWGRYLAARVLRIFPAFWACLVVTALIIAPLATSTFSTANVQYVVKNAGLWVMQYGIGGTPANVPYPGAWNGSLWTLGWEFLCYVGVLLLGVSGLLTRVVTLPLAFLLALLGLVLTAYGPIDNFYLTQGSRFGVMFLAGALIYRFAERILVRWYVVVAAASIIAVSLFLPDYRILAALPLAYCVIALGATIKSPRYRLKNDISYGVYIYAFPVQQVLAIMGLTALVPFMLLGIAATLPFAIGSWLLVERPSLRLKKRFTRRRPLPGTEPHVGQTQST